MTSNWRDPATAEVLLSYLGETTLDGPALVLNDPLPLAVEAIKVSGVFADWWSRRIIPGAMVAPFLPPGPYSTVLLRLPRSKDELEMLLHGAWGELAVGGRLLVYGANDEGATSADAKIEPLFGPVETALVKRRCRVLQATRPPAPPGGDAQAMHPELLYWHDSFPLELEGETREWVSFPGVFSHGRLDPGTALLLGALPKVEPGARVLDFGCGSGIIGATVLARQPDAEVDLLDNDILALVAAWENVPGGRPCLGTEMAATERGPYDLIVSNPPFHEGKSEDLDVIGELVAEAPGHLQKNGSLLMVVQRRLPVQRPLEAAFPRVEIVAEDATYRVWQGWRR